MGSPPQISSAEVMDADKWVCAQMTPLGPNLRTHQAWLEKEEQGEESLLNIEARRLMESRAAQQKN